MKKILTVGSLNLNSQSLSTVRDSRLSTIQTHSTFRIRLQQHQQELIVYPMTGQTLLQAARSQGQPIDFKCEKGTCGRCTVQVVEGSALLAPTNPAEQAKLGELLNQGYRLACQTKISLVT